MTQAQLNRIILLIVVLVISFIFFSMIRQFILVILLAGIFSGMFQPIYNRFVKWTKGNKNLGSALTLTFVLFLIFIPLAGLLSIVASQAIKISETIKPTISEMLNKPSAFAKYYENLPFYGNVEPYKDEILKKAGELVGIISTSLFDSLSSITKTTVNFIMLFFVFLYTMFFLLKDGEALLNKILYYLPLVDKDERRMLDRFTSVTRATIKGTMFIGVIQGGLAGLAFWVVGIDSAVFWGTIMTVLSIIPAVGSALVWLPAVVILAAYGHWIKAVGLLIFCGGLVGSVDNILRPKFVGHDTQMHELLIFFGTLGGLSMFGLVGFIIGPIIAALFTTVWDLYGENFKAYLPEVIPRTTKPLVPKKKNLPGK